MALMINSFPNNFKSLARMNMAQTQNASFSKRFSTNLFKFVTLASMTESCHHEGQVLEIDDVSKLMT